MLFVDCGEMSATLGNFVTKFSCYLEVLSGVDVG